MEIEVAPSTSTTVLGESPKASKLGNCEVCMAEKAKYTCPKCEVKFCCLRCSALHKRELECDGIRDRTKYIPMNKFTNLDLSSDYRLLEEIGRRIETYKRGLKKTHFKAKKDVLPHYLYKLRTAASKRKTILKFLPNNFLRHKANTTRLNFHKDVIYWHIDWIFANADDLKLSDEKVRESTVLASVLQKYFVKQENETLQEKLQFYQALGLSGIRVFLKAEEKAGDKYYELDINEDLKGNLRGKIIIEYPTIIVVNKEHGGRFDVIDSDDESDDNAMNVDVKPETDGNLVVDKMLRRAESEDSVYNSLKNLLFLSDNSDIDIDENEDD